MSVRDFHFFGKTAEEKKKAHHDEKTEDTDYEKKACMPAVISDAAFSYSEGCIAFRA